MSRVSFLLFGLHLSIIMTKPSRLALLSFGVLKLTDNVHPTLIVDIRDTLRQYGPRELVFDSVIRAQPVTGRPSILVQ